MYSYVFVKQQVPLIRCAHYFVTYNVLIAEPMGYIFKLERLVLQNLANARLYRTAATALTAYRRLLGYINMIVISSLRTMRAILCITHFQYFFSNLDVFNPLNICVNMDGGYHLKSGNPHARLPPSDIKKAYG